MNAVQQAEYNQLKHKAAALRLAAERLEDRAGLLQVCLDPATGCGDETVKARVNLAAACSKLMDCVETLAYHGKV
jgi:hypothetical protein